MHSVLEGVVKDLFNLWLGKENREINCSLRCFMQTIDTRLQNIHPPKFVPTATRSIYTWKTWRAHEYLSFLLYYSLPIFVDIMQNNYLQHLIKLCIFMEIILSREIKLSDLYFAQTLVEGFVKDFSNLYSESSMLSGVHELLHLTDCTKDFGPLNYMNCFPFEELNRKVIGLINGRDLLGEEFIKIFTLIQTLSATFSELPMDSKFYDFVKEEMKFKTSNKKNKGDKSVSTYKYLNKTNKLENETIKEIIKKKFYLDDDAIEELIFFNKIIYNSIIYTSVAIKTKYFDSCFTIGNNKFGLIENFFTLNEKHYVVARKLNRLNSPFFCEQNDSIISSLHLCHVSNNFFIEEIFEIKKSIFIQIEQKCFVSNFSISHLFN